MKTLRPALVRLACLALAAGASAPPLPAQVPQLLTYQGRVTQASAPFNGAGLFKFALVNSNATATFWSNDGSSLAGSQPNSAVTNAVNQGLFTVLLGDTSLSNMSPIAATVFTNSDVRLRLWFSDGTSAFAQQSPDQRLTAVGYALMASALPAGAVTSGLLAPNAVSSQAIATGAVTSAQLAVNAVTTAAISNGAVTSAKLASPARTLRKASYDMQLASCVKRIVTCVLCTAYD